MKKLLLLAVPILFSFTLPAQEKGSTCIVPVGKMLSLLRASSGTVKSTLKCFEFKGNVNNKGYQYSLFQVDYDLHDGVFYYDRVYLYGNGEVSLATTSAKTYNIYKSAFSKYGFTEVRKVADGTLYGHQKYSLLESLTRNKSGEVVHIFTMKQF